MSTRIGDAGSLARNGDAEDRACALRRDQFQLSAVVVHDAIAHGPSQPGALPGRLAGEKRFEHLRLQRARDGGTFVLDRQLIGSAVHHGVAQGGQLFRLGGAIERSRVTPDHRRPPVGDVGRPIHEAEDRLKGWHREGVHQGGGLHDHRCKLGPGRPSDKLTERAQHVAARFRPLRSRGTFADSAGRVARAAPSKCFLSPVRP